MPGHQDTLLPKPSALKPYAEAGWPFVLLHKWDATKKLPPSPKFPEGRVLELGKAPVGKGWTKTGSTAAQALAHMNAGKNVGALIPATWAVIDVDPRNFSPGDDSWERLQKDVGLDLSHYAIARTGSGGWHVFVRIPADYKGVVKIEKYPGIEFKQIGAQVVTAGSIHPKSRKHYEWMDGPVPMAQTGSVPDAILDLYKITRPQLAGVAGGETWGTLTQDQVRAGLKELDPSKFAAYDDWFGLMCSVHWLSGGEARSEWLEWSARDETYGDQSEKVAIHWDSLNRSSATATVVARGGLFFKALKTVGIEAHDGRFAISAEKCFTDLDADELKLDSEAAQTHQTVKREADAKTSNGVMDILNDKHFVLNYNGKTVIGSKKHVELKDGQEWDTFEFGDQSAFKLFYMNRKMPDGASWAEYWLQHPNRRTYDGFDFRPDEPQGAYRQNNGDLILNQWTGFALEPEEGDWGMFDDLLLNTICKGDQVKYDYLLNWTAYCYQNLSGPVGTAIVIKGLKGTGKTSFWEVFARPFGRTHAFLTAKMDNVFGNFNGMMHGKIAVGLEEAYFAGSKAAESQLKDLITGPAFGINEKFLPAYEQTNHAKVVIITNDDWAVPATEDERRFFVTETSHNRKDDDAFWIAYRKQMFENGGAEAFFHSMLKRDISGFRPYHDLPKTEELLGQIELTRGPVIEWMAEKLQYGDSGFSYAWTSRKGNFIIPQAEFWEDFRNWLAANPRGRFGTNITTKAAFTRELKRVVPEFRHSTGSPPAGMEHMVHTYQASVAGKNYQIANVFVFDHGFHGFRQSLVNRYGLSITSVNADDLDIDDDFSILDTDEWDFI